MDVTRDGTAVSVGVAVIIRVTLKDGTSHEVRVTHHDNLNIYPSIQSGLLKKKLKLLVFRILDMVPLKMRNQKVQLWKR